MKKIKITLTAITVVAVIGGALAFKTHNRTGSLYCSSVSGTAGVCTTRYSEFSNGSSLYCTTTNGGTCSTVTSKVIRDAK